ncbi:uncharacterized protein TNCV_4041681 [Trichonephila clavipes]|nr:uncharacterized protein TNCV_4041681 [Trichonephila clavipes]
MTKGDFFDISFLGNNTIKNRECFALSSMFELDKTRPLPGHSSIGSIRTRTQLRSGVPPPTTEFNKEGSVPVIWPKKPGTAPTWSTPRIECYSIRARNQRVNPTPLICSTNPTALSPRGHRREVPPADRQERAHSSATHLQ